MSTKTYFKSIALNNEGCEHLECGDFVSARNCFRDALQLMTVAIVEAQNEMEHQVHPLDTGERHSDFQWSVLPRMPLHANSETFTYRRAIFVYRSGLDESPPPSAFELSDESSMIVYNLGLSFHMLALSTNTSIVLNEALGFYQIAEAIRSRRSQDNAAPELIDLALYNNMGHIYYEAVNYEQARQHFMALKRCLICFAQQGLVDFIAPQDSDGFVLNASMQEVTLAAAA